MNEMPELASIGVWSRSLSLLLVLAPFLSHTLPGKLASYCVDALVGWCTFVSILEGGKSAAISSD